MLEGVGYAVLGELALDVPLAVGHDVIVRRTALDDIILDNAAPAQAIVKAAAGDLYKVGYGDGGMLRVEGEHHRAEALGFNRAAHQPTFTSLKYRPPEAVMK